MPKSPSKPESNWLVEVAVRGENGKAVYGPDGKLLKTKIQMEDATFADGTAQSLYFEPGHPKAGLFKGMEVILQERGLVKESKLKVQCNSKFQCPDRGQTSCCCRRVLYNQPDFAQVESLLEAYCKSRGVDVIFLPKFHCELNFIEQCWGYAKQIYRHYPPSSKEADLEQNVISALEAVPLSSMRKSVLPLVILASLTTVYRFSTRSCRFMDAYEKGLDGKQAMWASKKYQGHRVLPEKILEEYNSITNN